MWWLSYILLPLILCFLSGLLIGLALWWWWRRRTSSEHHRYQLESELEQDRLRREVMALKAGEEKANTLETEVIELRNKARRLPQLETDLEKVKRRAGAIPSLEQQIADLRLKADDAERLETEVVTLRGRANVADSLEGEVIDLRTKAALVPTLESEVVTLRSDSERLPALDAELRSARQVLEQTSGRASNLEAELSSTKADVERLEAEAAKVAELESQITRFRGRAETADQLEINLRDAQAEASRVEGLTAELAAARTEAAQIPALHADLETARAEARQVSSLRASLETAHGEAERAAALTVELQTARAESERLTAQLKATGVEADKVAGLNQELAAAKAEADKVAGLNRELATAKAEVARARTFETQVQGFRKTNDDLSARANRIPALEAEIKRLTDQQRSLEASTKEANSTADKAKRDLAELRKQNKAEKKAPKNPAASGGSWRSGTTKLGTPGANHVDDLKVVSGIGPVLEKTLNGFGIQTWEQLAAFTKADINKVDEALAFPGRIDRDQWVDQAKALLAKGHTPGEETSSKKSKKKPAKRAGVKTDRSGRVLVSNWSRGKTKLGTEGAGHRDDLKVVNGIGPVLEKTLNGYDIQTWEQLATFTRSDIDKVDDALSFPGRIERDEWVSQAKDLVKRFPLTSPYHRPTRATYLNASSDDDPWN